MKKEVSHNRLETRCTKPSHLSVGLDVRQSGIKPQFENHLGTALEQRLEQSKVDSEVSLLSLSYLSGGPNWQEMKPFVRD